MIIVTVILGLLIHIHVVNSATNCSLSPTLKSEIQSYQDIVKLIQQYVVDKNGPFKTLTWTKLGNFVDDFGSRIVGSENLENAIDFMQSELESFKLDNVHGENVSVPHWVRNEEYALLTKPRKVKLSMLGLGGSIGTPKEGIKASVVVVESFKELKSFGRAQVQGKIVVFNQKFVSYEKTVKYRVKGAIEASKLGAVAVLIRSITPLSINSPHTGALHYDEEVPRIPAACITVENAQMLHRFYKRGISLEISLYMGAENLPTATSRNLVAEIEGKQDPSKVVLLSGHLDSWDVGQGAMDDGGGAFTSWLSLVVLRQLKLQPRRTVRAVLWTSEELGLNGAMGYLNQHKSELANFNLVMESDMGTFKPNGLIFYGSPDAACIVEEIAKLMTPFNATVLEKSPIPVESDISIFQKYGIPGVGLRTDNDRYFWFHHTEGDMMTVEDPTSLDLCTALFATYAYIIADLSVELPRTVTHLSHN